MIVDLKFLNRRRKKQHIRRAAGTKYADLHNDVILTSFFLE